MLPHYLCNVKFFFSTNTTCAAVMICAPDSVKTPPCAHGRALVSPPCVRAGFHFRVFQRVALTFGQPAFIHLWITSRCHFTERPPSLTGCGKNPLSFIRQICRGEQPSVPESSFTSINSFSIVQHPFFTLAYRAYS
jgi:hypothetical protein